MRSIFIRTLTLMLITALGTWYCVVHAQAPAKPQQPAKHDVKDKELAELAFQRAKLLKATNEPHPVFDRSTRALAMTACIAPIRPEEEKARPENPHGGFSILVYLTHNGREMMATGKGAYPVGTVILKEKMLSVAVPNQAPANQAPNANNKAHGPPAPQYTTALFTGMLKREMGYNTAGGDWEYFVVNGDAKKLLARGKIDSCIDCHQAYKETDYVTRAYMPSGK